METGDDTVLQIPTMRERETDAGPNGLNQNVTDTRENKLDRILSEYGPALSRLAFSYERDASAREELLQEIVVPETFLLTLSHDGHVRRSCSKIWQFATVVGVKFSERAALDSGGS